MKQLKKLKKIKNIVEKAKNRLGLEQYDQMHSEALESPLLCNFIMKNSQKKQIKENIKNTPGII